MAFFDLFRPAWKHSDSSVRRAAVEQLDNQEDLATVAKQDPDAEIRRLALKRLTDRHWLRDVA